MPNDNDGYRTIPVPRERALMVDGGRLGRQRHTVHGLFEVDVTQAYDAIRQHKGNTGETLSFTAFILACLGRALDENKQMHAYRSRRRQLILFDDVDVNTLFEVQVAGRPMIRPHIIRAVNRKTFRTIHDEIRSFQSVHAGSEEASFIHWFVRLPGFVRRLFLGMVAREPWLIKKFMGTVALTNIGMFGTHSGWGLPVPNHSLQLTLGGMAEKPGIVAGRIEIRRYLSVTISFDHDVVDGAPAARFTQRLRELMECAYGVDDATAAQS